MEGVSGLAVEVVCATSPNDNFVTKDQKDVHGRYL